MSTEEQVITQVERMELARLAGMVVGAIELLRHRSRELDAEGVGHEGLANKLHGLVYVRERLMALADSLPEGPLEAFGREHPLYEDQLDGPFCGYEDENGKQYTCPVRDQALHWDAWELRGTRFKRPKTAVRD